MKIGIDCRLIGIQHGGIGRYTLELLKNILEIDEKNEYYLFYNQDGESDVFELVGKKLLARGVKTNIRHYSFMEQLKFHKILNEYSLDLVHFPNFNVPLFYNKPFIVTIHDVVHHKISGAKKSRLPHFWAYKKIIQNAANKSNKIITVSEAAKREIVKYLNTPENKIQVIYEAANLVDDISADDVVKIKERFILNEPYFLFVGVLERKKNLINLARGFDQFLKRFGLNVDLVIAGRADKHYPEIKQHMLQIKNSERLIFTGEVSETQLKALYKGAYAFVSASLHEGFGLPGVEAMKFNLPLVVSNIEVFNEIYDNAAVYFDALNLDDIAEKLQLLARDVTFHRQMQEKSFYRGQLFSWKKAAIETINLYVETINNLKKIA